ncbi:MAG: hypothetical protein WDN46_10120 [Methylocella sp.]
MNQELVAIPPQTVFSVFTTENAIDPILARVRKEIDAFVPDIKTARGRKDIAAIAYSVARSKTYLDDLGKKLADDQKAVPKKIDAARKHIRDTLDAWKEEVRKPLTDWETAEETRVKKHTDAIAALSSPSLEVTAAELRQLIQASDAVEITPANCEEFEPEYARAKDASLRSLRAALEKREKFEAEQAELAELRKLAAEREAKDRDETIRREAEAKAEERATAIAKAEREKLEAAAKAEREAAERRELQLKLDAEAANRRALETEQRLKREAAEAVDREAKEAALREANRNHCGQINRAAAAALVQGGLTEDQARTVIGLIAKKLIPHVTISY